MTEISLKPDDIKKRKINLEAFFSALVKDEHSQSLRNSLIKYLDFIGSQTDEDKENQK